MLASLWPFAPPSRKPHRKLLGTLYCAKVRCGSNALLKKIIRHREVCQIKLQRGGLSDFLGSKRCRILMKILDFPWFFWFCEAVQRHFEHCFTLLWDQKCRCRFPSGLCLWKNRLGRCGRPVRSYFLGSKSWLKSPKQWNSTIPNGNGNKLFSHPWQSNDCSWPLLDLFFQENLTSIDLATRYQPNSGIKNIAKITKTMKFSGFRGRRKSIVFASLAVQRLLLVTFKFISSRKIYFRCSGGPTTGQIMGSKCYLKYQKLKTMKIKHYWKRT